MSVKQTNGQYQSQLDHRSEEQRRKDMKLSRILLIIGICVLALAVGCMAYAGIVLEKSGTVLSVILATGLVLFWLIMDVISPIVTHEMDSMTPAQKTTARLTAVLDLIGYGGLAFFFFAMSSNTGIYGVLVYGAANIFRRKLNDDMKDAEKAEAEKADAQEPSIVDNTDDSSRTEDN